MDQSEFGRLSIALTIISLVSMVALAGVDQAATRFVTQYSREGASGLLRGFRAWSNRIVFGAGGVAAALTTVACLILSPDWFWSSGLALLIPAILLMNYIASIRGQLIGRGKPILGQLAEQLARPLVVLAGILGLAYAGDVPITASAAAGAILASFVVAATIQAVISGRHRADAPPKFESMHWRRIALPLMLTSGVFLLMNRTDLLLVGGLLGDDDAAEYAVAARVATLIGIPLIATQQVFNRQIAAIAGSTHRFDALASAAQRVSVTAGILSIAIFVPMCLALNPILAIFGPEYVVAEPLVWLLGGAFVIAAWLGPTGKILGLNGCQNVLAVLVLIAAVTNLILGWILISAFGSIGAAIATGVSTIVWKVSAIIVIHRRFGILVPFSTRASKSLQAERP